MASFTGTTGKRVVQQEPARQRHERTILALSLTNFAIGTPVPVWFLWNGGFRDAAVSSIFWLSFLLVPWLLQRGAFEAARMLLTLMGTIVIVFYAAMLGRGAGMQTLLFANACLPLILADRTERGFLAGTIALPIVGWIVLEVGDYALLPRLELDAGLERQFRRVLFGVAVFGLLNQVFYFFRYFYLSQAALDKLHRGLWSDLHFARDLQQRLLPRTLTAPGLELAAAMQPTAHVGGDYYDLIGAGDRRWLAIGDVSGHGVTSGLIAMMVQRALRTTVEREPSASPSHVLTLVNRAIYPLLERVGADQYMTLTIIRCDPGGSFVHAGRHLDLLVYRAVSDAVEALPTEGVWLGILDEIGALSSDRTLRLEPGDRLLLFTDGILEATKDGAMLEQQTFERWLRDAAATGAKPAVILEQLRAAQRAYEQRDDQTWLVVATKPPR